MKRTCTISCLSDIAFKNTAYHGRNCSIVIFFEKFIKQIKKILPALTQFSFLALSCLFFIFILVICSCCMCVALVFVENRNYNQTLNTKRSQWRYNLFMYYRVYTKVFRKRVCRTIVTSWQFEDVTITRQELFLAAKIKIQKQESYKCI